MVSCFLGILRKKKNWEKSFSADDNEDDDSYWNIVGISMSWIESKMGTKEEFLEKNWTTFDKILFSDADLIMSTNIQHCEQNTYQEN